jgi:hypothetical protein
MPLIWKSMVQYFPLIGNRLVWSVGNGIKVRIEMDPWMGSGVDFKIIEAIVTSLHREGIYNITQVASLETSSIWK